MTQDNPSDVTRYAVSLCVGTHTLTDWGDRLDSSSVRCWTVSWAGERANHSQQLCRTR